MSPVDWSQYIKTIILYYKFYKMLCLEMQMWNL